MTERESNPNPPVTRPPLSRRELGKLVFSGALGSAILAGNPRSRAATHAAAEVVRELAGGPGLKICAQMGARPSDDDLLFLQQIGIQHCCVREAGIPGPELTELLATADGAGRSGSLQVSRCHTHLHQQPQDPFHARRTLGLASRDESTRRSRNTARVGQAGVITTQHNFGLS